MNTAWQSSVSYAKGAGRSDAGARCGRQRADARMPTQTRLTAIAGLALAQLFMFLKRVHPPLAIFGTVSAQVPDRIAHANVEPAIVEFVRLEVDRDGQACAEKAVLRLPERQLAERRAPRDSRAWSRIRSCSS